MGNQQCWCSRAPAEAAEGERVEELLPRLQPTRPRAAGARHSMSTSSSEFGKKRLGARGGLSSPILRTNSSPALLFEEARVRPKWHCAAGARNARRAPLEDFLAAQRRTLAALRDLAARGAWLEVHAMHFDWWMFPIEDGRRPEYNVFRADVAELRADATWRAGYAEGVALVARAWGWDAARAEPIPDGARHAHQRWNFWDVRLAKMVRSLWLFDEEKLFLSMQKLARTLKPDGGFRYGTLCLDEILYFQTPLPAVERSPDRPRTRSSPSEDAQP